MLRRMDSNTRSVIAVDSLQTWIAYGQEMSNFTYSFMGFVSVGHHNHIFKMTLRWFC